PSELSTLSLHDALPIFEALESGATAPVVSEAHHDEVVRRDDQRDLCTRAGHVVRVPGHRKATLAVDPEERAVNGAPVRLPRGCRSEERRVGKEGRGGEW